MGHPRGLQCDIAISCRTHSQSSSAEYFEINDRMRVVIEALR
jgi:hypothetical protein